MLPLSSALLLAAAAVVARSSPFLEHRQEIANGTTSDLASNIKATASATTAAAPATASSLQIISPTSLPDSPPNTAYVNSSMPVPTSAIANGTIGLPSSATTPSQLPNTAYTSSMTNVTAAPAGVSATASTATASAASAAETSPQAFSPPNYPTPEVRGEGAWAEAVRKAKETLSTEGWDLAAKVNLTTGVGWTNGPCVGNIAAQPAVSFPGLCLQDSPVGIRFADYVSVFPAGINAASTFDRALIRKRGLAMGREFRAKGVNVALGPMMNMGRDPQGGRNWEGFGADPYLTGEAAYETIKGMQTPGQGVQACAKHYIANEIERNRTESSSNINDRAMQEIYVHPFLKSVQAEVASVMCSYNLINNSWACQNSKMQNDVLKHQLGFQGYILSDWQATESGVGSVLAGLDMTMPGDVTFSSGTTYFGANLTEAVNNGSVPMSRVDDMATRILAGYYLLEQDEDFPEVNFNSWNINDPVTNKFIDVQEDHYKLIREIGAASTVLLKNTKGRKSGFGLPLTGNERSLGIIGNGAGPSSKGPNGYSDRGGNDGILALGWGSGTSEFPYLISPLEAIQAKARENRTSLAWNLNNFDYAGINKTAAYKDAALVFINSDSGEGYITVDKNEGDRNNITAWGGGDDMVRAVAANNENTIVIIHSVGPIIVEPWIDHPNVTAVVYAGLPGQEAGNSLVDILYGAYNPSARLPFTMGRQLSDYPAQINFVNSSEPPHPQIDYIEELNIDYRHFLSKKISPRFPFGFGLSYTTFKYDDLNIWKVDESKRDVVEQRALEFRGNPDSEFMGEVGSSLAPWLHADAYMIEFTITNTGDVNGCDVPQLYLRFPKGAGEPPRVLRGFERLNLDPGVTKKVQMPLSKYSMSIWDVIAQKWVVPEGVFGVVIAQDSFDTQLEGTIPRG